MEGVYKPGKMEENMMVNKNKIKKTDMEHICGQMAENMKVNGKMENNTEPVIKLCQIIVEKPVNGLKVKD